MTDPDLRDVVECYLRYAAWLLAAGDRRFAIRCVGRAAGLLDGAVVFARSSEAREG